MHQSNMNIFLANQSGMDVSFWHVFGHCIYISTFVADIFCQTALLMRSAYRYSCSKFQSTPLNFWKPNMNQINAHKRPTFLVAHRYRCHGLIDRGKSRNVSGIQENLRGSDGEHCGEKAGCWTRRTVEVRISRSLCCPLTLHVMPVKWIVLYDIFMIWLHFSVSIGMSVTFLTLMTLQTVYR